MKLLIHKITMEKQKKCSRLDGAYLPFLTLFSIKIEERKNIIRYFYGSKVVYDTGDWLCSNKWKLMNKH